MDEAKGTIDNVRDWLTEQLHIARKAGLTAVEAIRAISAKLEDIEWDWDFMTVEPLRIDPNLEKAETAIQFYSGWTPYDVPISTTLLY